MTPVLSKDVLRGLVDDRVDHRVFVILEAHQDVGDVKVSEA